MARLAGLAALLIVAACLGHAKPPISVLLVTIDTLRADRVGCYGDRLARTPHLDAVARAGLLFENAFTSAPLTLPAHTTIMTGLIPPAHGVRGNVGFALPAGIPTLAETLRSRGLTTGAFVGGFPLHSRFGLSRGFDVYDDNVQKAAGLHYEFAERRADAVAARVLAFLSAHGGPVFVWAHFFDPHAPYDPPAAFRTGDAYRDEIASADAALGSLLAAWDARPGATLVVVTADHGEAFSEHDEESHSLFVYDTTLRVPLLLRGAGVPKGVRVRPNVGLVDLAATILALSGETRTALPGSSLLGAASGPASGPARPLYAETLAPMLDFGWSDLRAWREGSWKYVRAPRQELYDLAVDPGETKNCAGERPDVARAMEAALTRLLAQQPERASRRGLDDATRERLQSLGYVHAPGGRGSGADPKDKVAVARRIARSAGPFQDAAEAARVYAEIAALDPENPLVNLRLADALLRSGRPRDAAVSFERVVAGGPLTADPFVGLATAYAQLERLADAERVLKQALAVEPRNGQIHFNLGELLRSRGNSAGARGEYQQALQDPVTRSRAEARLREISG